MGMAIEQLNLFEELPDHVQLIMLNLKNQHDSLRKKVFAEIQDLKREIEFLSLQIQLMEEEKKGKNKLN